MTQSDDAQTSPQAAPQAASQTLKEGALKEGTLTEEAPTERTPTEKLAALVAQRKAKAAGAQWGGGSGGLRGQERVAAARSASKSKPALRK